MKKPERLVGFVKYEEVDFSFEFDENTFCLMLYPPTRDVWEGYSGFKTLIEKLSKSKSGENWIGSLKINGITSELYSVVFNVTDNTSNYQGFLSLEVNWYVLCTGDLTPNNISGFIVTGVDINRYYSPQTALEACLNIEGNRAKRMSVSSVEVLPESCGTYNIQGNLSVHTEVYAYANFKARTWTNPISANSEVVTSFSEPIGTEILLEAFMNLKRFFKIVKYHRIVNFDDVELFNIDVGGKKVYSGLLCVKENTVYISQQQEDRIKLVTHNQIGVNLSKFLEDSKGMNIGLLHLINSTEINNSYTSSSIFMILVAFEQIFTAINGKEAGRSTLYLEVKNEIIDLLNNYEIIQSGKRKKYVKSLKEYVSKRDSSFEDALKKSFNKHEEVMLPFVLHSYDGEYQNETEGISLRMGELRNEIAHGRLDFDYLPIHVKDIHVIECLLYAMLLKENNICTINAKEAINKLFDKKMVNSD